MKFVIQEHYASQHHFDFRLEMEGVARSWAVPKGLPEEKGQKRLAIAVEDHSVDYMDFEGHIPEEMYGGGDVLIWDNGEYELVEKKDQELKIKLNGKKVEGTFVMFKFPKAGENAWLILKKD